MTDGNETASAPAGDGELQQAAERVQRRVGEWDSLQGWEPRDRFAAFGENLRHDAMTLVAAALARPRAAVGERPDREFYDTFVEFEGWLREYRVTMQPDVMKSWAADMLKTGKAILAMRDRILALQSPPAKAEG